MWHHHPLYLGHCPGPGAVRPEPRAETHWMWPLSGDAPYDTQAVQRDKVRRGTSPEGHSTPGRVPPTLPAEPSWWQWCWGTRVSEGTEWSRQAKGLCSRNREFGVAQRVACQTLPGCSSW